MKHKSAFLETHGDTARNRLWSFLIVHQEYDYSMKDISKFTGVSYSALKYLIQDFLRTKLIIQTRTVGRSKMYKLNLTNPIVDKFIDFYWAVIESQIEPPNNRALQDQPCNTVMTIGSN